MSKDIVKTIYIEGMHCEGCVNRVKNILNNIKEVKKCQVDLGKAEIVLKKDNNIVQFQTTKNVVIQN